MKTYLILNNGSIYPGEAFGSQTEVFGEMVFNTNITEYQKTITDPSYYDKIMVFTYPSIGNYGINLSDSEHANPYVSGIVAHEIAEVTSNYHYAMSLNEYAEKYHIPGIKNINTRQLTKEISQHGALTGIITPHPQNAKIQSWLQQHPSNSVSSTAGIYHITGPGPKVAVIDYGIKNSILKELMYWQADITIFSADSDVQTILASKPDGVILSNGPGNPANMKHYLPVIQVLQEKLPILGICLGNQLLGLANGATTFKMKFGHHGFNHIVKDVATNKCYFTDQNHDYAIDPQSIPNSNLSITFNEINDQTVEGIQVKGHNAFAIQFYPNTSTGPHNARFVFTHFFELIQQNNGKIIYI